MRKLRGANKFGESNDKEEEEEEEEEVGRGRRQQSVSRVTAAASH